MQTSLLPLNLRLLEAEERLELEVLSSVLEMDLVSASFNTKKKKNCHIYVCNVSLQLKNHSSRVLQCMTTTNTAVED